LHVTELAKRKHRDVRPELGADPVAMRASDRDAGRGGGERGSSRITRAIASWSQL